MTAARTRSVLALAGTVVALASGCGESKGLSRAELIAKADPICQRANAKLDSSNISPQNIAQVAPGIAAVDRQVSAELAKLTPPSSMAGDWTIIVDGFRKSGVGLERLGAVPRISSLKKPSKAVIEAETVFTGSQDARASAGARSGFKDCARF